MEVEVGRTYKHFKGGLYLVLGIGKYSETEEDMVIYKALYGDNLVWIRPLNNFIEVVNKNGQKNRFEKIIIESKEESWRNF